ncbi:hypothetical protein [Streptomyces sp. DH8]|uniref:hypothetical protein n=1 Tax=Streptomyces sp. DH8 TaxID=2857008 RepID=UPI001E5776C1|nr:hypothetical protein [Streptomyces sp. DH8]
MLLKDLCSTFGRSANWYGVLSSSYGIREEREGDANYEVPDVREVSSCTPLPPSLVLITAPAAVGKSAAASYIGNILHAPILDLSRLQVGDGTLEGALSKSFGIRRNADFSEAMLEGKATLIVDALDEAEVRSGQANFRAFVRGVADTAAQISGEKAAIVILSRAESARTLQELFTERGLQYSHYEIRPFGREQAERYLGRRVTSVFESRGKEPLHLRHEQPYKASRNKLFSVLASAITEHTSDIWSNSDVRDFLGYAPVLDVAAEYLAVENFATLERSLSRSRSVSFAHWDMVADVIDQLLLREQDKFVNQYKETDSFKRKESGALLPVLYAPEEQCARLLDYVENMRLDLDIPVSLPSELRESYDAAVDTQLSNHPFLRGDGWFNVIFRDYVTARAQCSALVSEKSSQAIRRGVLSSSWKHSPMYAFFSHSLGRAAEEESSSCHSEDVGSLYESLKSTCEAEDRLFVTAGKAGNRLMVTFSIYRGEVAEPVLFLTFFTHEGTTSISFPRELSYANIWNVPEVTIGGDHPSFKFGSSVYISCGDLLLSASEIQAYVGASENPILLSSGSLVSDGVKIQADSTDLIVICEDDLPYPWSRYQRRLDVGGLAADARESRYLYLEFRRLVLRFKDAKRGEAAVYKPMMDNLVVGTNKRAQTIMNYLTGMGYVKVSKSMYLLDLAIFAQLGISRSQLRDLDFTDAAKQVSKDILRYSKK